MPTYPLMLANLASGSTGPSSHFSLGPSSHLSLTIGFPRLLSTAFSLLAAFFCRLPCFANCLVLSWDLAFPCLLPVSWEILHASPLYGFHAKTDKGIPWLAPTSTETNAPLCVTFIFFFFYCTFYMEEKIILNNYCTNSCNEWPLKKLRCFCHISNVMNDPKLLAMLANKNMFSTSN